MQKLLLSLLLLLASVPAWAQNAPTTFATVRITSTSDTALCVGGSGVTPTSCVGGIKAGKGAFGTAVILVDETTAGVRIDVSGGVARIREGDNSADAPLQALSVSAQSLLVQRTTTQVQTGYDGSNYFTTTVSSAGAVTFDAVGAGAGFTLADQVTTPKVRTGASGWHVLSAGDATDGAWIATNIDGARGSTVNQPAMRMLGDSSSPFMIQTSPATAVGVSRTWTTRATLSTAGVLSVPGGIVVTGVITGGSYVADGMTGCSGVPDAAHFGIVVTCSTPEAFRMRMLGDLPDQVAWLKQEVARLTAMVVALGGVR